jgi:hypothetical protein
MKREGSHPIRGRGWLAEVAKSGVGRTPPQIEAGGGREPSRSKPGWPDPSQGSREPPLVVAHDHPRCTLGGGAQPLPSPYFLFLLPFFIKKNY